MTLAGNDPARREEGLRHVPRSVVARLVGSYIDDGAVALTCLENADGSWSIRAAFNQPLTEPAPAGGQAPASDRSSD